ncbi:transposase [Kitasatospora sp. NPDC101235]|uniref:transposase n=1 Tax=Kitasatospora sp. NPDC101235 TaxID=3364101 RepID=UPI0038233C20
MGAGRWGRDGQACPGGCGGCGGGGRGRGRRGAHGRSRELRTLASGIRRDHAAVLAALNTTLTSGAVEGNVTRIKLLKRQMYGRANFDLLRRRILLSP